MKTEDSREIVYYPLTDSRNEKKVVNSLLNKPSLIIEVSLPTIRVPSLIRIETMLYSLRFKKEKKTSELWMSLGKTLAKAFGSIKVGESEEIRELSLLLDKSGEILFSESEEKLYEVKHLSPGWLKVQESDVFIDFFSLM